MWFSYAIDSNHWFWSSTRFHDLKKEERLKELQERLSSSELELQRCDAKKQHILSELEKNRDVIRSRDRLRRNIEDNLNYRKTKAEVDELTREIESLEEKILRIGGISTFESELVKLSRERERLLSEVLLIFFFYITWFLCLLANYWYSQLENYQTFRYFLHLMMLRIVLKWLLIWSSFFIGKSLLLP